MKKPRRGAKADPTPRRKAARPVAAGKLQMLDIAKMAGVSPSTVSRALNNSSLVNAETRERIEELARSLRYSVNVGASNLRMQRNRTVAVVLPLDAVTRQNVTDPFFVSLLGNIADALTARGYDMLLSRVDAERLDLAGELVTSGRAIGVIMIGQWHHHDQLNDLAAQNVPIAVWGANLQQQLYCTVGCDNITGGMLATEHLISAGRRQIAFFGDVELPEIGHRFEGYRRVLTNHHIEHRQDWVHLTPFVGGSATAAVDELVRRRTRFDAIFASSDLLAIEAMGALRKHGRDVPQQIAVVGYDDIELARYCHPALTTIRQPVANGAEGLIDTLLKVVAGKRPKPQILSTELIVRDSSANPQSGAVAP
jgi:DNA-binding LacI/PurR family transcriptional regulator